MKLLAAADALMSLSGHRRQQVWDASALRSTPILLRDAPVNEDLLELNVDVLAPCALENQITAVNANSIKAKLIVEGANGPTTAGADEILNKKGIVIIPDILANGGGVTVSYFEWVQNRTGYYYSEDEINKRADRWMRQAFHNVWNVAESHKVSMRIGAYIFALEKVAKATRARGAY